MKRVISLISFLALVFASQAQERLNYKLNGEIIEFTTSQEEIYVEFDPNQKSDVQRIAKVGLEELTEYSAILRMAELQGDFQKRKQELLSSGSINFQRVEPILIYEELQKILKAMTTNLVEMHRNRSFALCCGAGGAQRIMRYLLVAM